MANRRGSLRVDLVFSIESFKLLFETGIPLVNVGIFIASKPETDDNRVFVLEELWVEAMVCSREVSLYNLRKVLSV